MHGTYNTYIICIVLTDPAAVSCVSLIAERRERSERSEATNRVLFEIPRYLYI